MESIFKFKDEKDGLKAALGEKLSNSLVLIGASQSCKTALLLQAAINEADTGNQVLYVSPKKLSNLPSSIHGMPQPSSHAMKNIQFLYAQTAQELQGYLASLHLRPLSDKPSVIIVDELNSYCVLDEGDPTDVLCLFSKLSSLISEATFFPSHSESSQEDEDTHGKAALMSWTLNRENSSAKFHDLDMIARRNGHEVWTTKKVKGDSVGSCFRLETEDGVRSLIINLTLKDINPNSRVIYLQDILRDQKLGIPTDVHDALDSRK